MHALPLDGDPHVCVMGRLVSTPQSARANQKQGDRSEKSNQQYRPAKEYPLHDISSFPASGIGSHLRIVTNYPS
jgi:hypothetical protein